MYGSAMPSLWSIQNGCRAGAHRNLLLRQADALGKRLPDLCWRELNNCGEHTAMSAHSCCLHACTHAERLCQQEQPVPCAQLRTFVCIFQGQLLHRRLDRPGLSGAVGGGGCRAGVAGFCKHVRSQTKMRIVAMAEHPASCRARSKRPRHWSSNCFVDLSFDKPPGCGKSCRRHSRRAPNVAYLARKMQHRTGVSIVQWHPSDRRACGETRRHLPGFGAASGVFISFRVCFAVEEALRRGTDDNAGTRPTLPQVIVKLDAMMIHPATGKPLGHLGHSSSDLYWHLH